MQKNPDVAESGINPLMHYVLHGRHEKRYAYEVKEAQSKCDIGEKRVVKNNNVFKQIRNSGYWDEAYYLSQVSDVPASDALEHYLNIGWKDSKNPSPKFDTKAYLQKNPDVAESGINPLMHYVLHGQHEKRYAYEVKESILRFTEVEKWFLPEPSIPKLKLSKPIDLLIPVYNGFEYLKPLFESLMLHTSVDYRIIVCDDCSPDERVWNLLQKIKKNDTENRMVLLQNQQNLGFVKTVNRLASLAENHFVIVNTDIEVPPGWLERLMYPIVSMSGVATTTPFTNAGTICSFPKYLEDNTMIEGKNVKDVDAVFQHVNFESTFIEIPTGVGFCMGINKNVVDKIGMFDEVFGKGYGEENDFCQRAIKVGYRNLHVTNLFVYHKHGGSFSSKTKKKLIKDNLQILNKKHPTYDQQVQKVIQENRLHDLREFLYFQLMTSKKKKVLFIDHDLGGGAVDYRNMEIEKRTALEEIVILLTFDFHITKQFTITIFFENEFLEYTCESSKKLFSLFPLFNINIDEIFLNSLVSYQDLSTFIDVLIDFQTKNRLELHIPIHDYFPLCPSYTLLNEKNEYCAIPNDLNVCNMCLKKNVTAEYKHFTQETDIKRWRSMWGKVFDHATSIICFSNSSKNIVMKVYPVYAKKIKVIPHNILGRYENIYDKMKSKNNEIRIGILGGINIAKGAYVIKNMIKYIDDNNIGIKIILIGDIGIEINSPSFQKTGRYKKEELSSIIKNLHITKFFIPSIWPETFSYTTEEIMHMGYPLVVFDIGAPAERVRNYDKGYIFDENINNIDFKKLIGAFLNDID